MNNRKRRHLIGAAFLSVAFPVLTRAQNFSFLRQSYDVVIAGAGAAGLTAAIEAAGFDARIRPEALTLEDFAKIQQALAR